MGKAPYRKVPYKARRQRWARPHTRRSQPRSAGMPSHTLDRCGLVKAVHEASGDVEWVAEEQKDAFEKEGVEILGRHVNKKSAPPRSPCKSRRQRSISASVGTDLSVLRQLVQATL